MKSLRSTPLSGIAAALLSLACVALPVPSAAAELSPATQLEHDLISGTHGDNLKKAGQPLADLDSKFRTALEKYRAETQAAGKLDAVEKIDAALKSFDAGNPPTADSSDPELAKLGKAYLEKRTKLEVSLKAAFIDAWTLHRQKLEGLVTRLTKEGKIDDAKIVRDEASAVEKTIANLSGKPLIKSARDLILSTEWEAKQVGEKPWTVKFHENGTATRGGGDKGKETVAWKWKIEDEKILWCHWPSNGWVKFQIPDLRASKLEGVSKGGDKWSLTPPF
ncbi:hypothetical protein [Luteolibacter soli]|uniref:Uncharacterized protein n=1 Tax=Luteolibacter soli TaxID=3135280 RepID=A0ABU9AUA9_9BACT